MATTNGKRNRHAGHAWEREIIRKLKSRNLYPHCVSTRSESRNLDNCGIDVMNRDELANGMMHDSIQAKSVSGTVKYSDLLACIKQAKRPNPVIFHRLTSKSSSRFMVDGKFAITYLDTYIELIAARQMVSRLKVLLPTLPDDLKAQIELHLKELGL
jgi:hypothetical protein